MRMRLWGTLYDLLIFLVYKWLASQLQQLCTILMRPLIVQQSALKSHAQPARKRNEPW